MTDAVLGIDVSKNTFDTNLGAGTKARSKSFANSPAGWHHLIAWLGEHKIGQVHACLEATGRHGLGIALALHEAGHVVSIVNPAQIRDFARTKLGRNKTDQVDAVHIREYAELFKPRPWTPPSPAMRRLCELQTIRAGTVAGLTEWKNRRGSGIMDDLALSLAKTKSSILPPSLRRSTKPLPRQSTTTWSCPPNATYWLASTEWEKPWLASCWPNCRVPISSAPALRSLPTRI